MACDPAWNAPPVRGPTLVLLLKNDIGVYIAALRGATEVTTGHPILDGFIAAFAAFLIIWIAALLIRTFKSAPELYFKERDRADDLSSRITPRIRVSYDENVLSCNCEVGFVDGTRSKIFRLKIDNLGTSRLYQCEGWLESIREFPYLSAARLFWVGIPEQGEVSLTKGIPRFLQILRIRQDNTIFPATFGVPSEQWPIDLQGSFVPGKYLFKIGIKGHDEADTVFYNIEFNWTGDWKTATVRHVEG